MISTARATLCAVSGINNQNKVLKIRLTVPNVPRSGSNPSKDVSPSLSAANHLQGLQIQNWAWRTRPLPEEAVWRLGVGEHAWAWVLTLSASLTCAASEVWQWAGVLGLGWSLGGGHSGPLAGRRKEDELQHQQQP